MRLLSFTIFFLLSASFASAGSSNATDENIDLNCGKLSELLVEKLKEESLLAPEQETQTRAETIIIDLCSETEDSAQQQHLLQKKAAMDNWFFEYHADKEGNRRLKTRR